MIKKIISFLTAFLLFFFPLFFIPFPNAVSPDQDKQYLLSAITLLILLFYIIHLLVRKKSKFTNTPYIVPLGLISFIYLISAFLFTTNKISALSMPSSTGTIVLLTLLYFLMTQLAFSIFPLLVSAGTLGVIFLLQNSPLLSSLKLPFDNLTAFTFFLPVTVLILSEIIGHWISLKKKRVNLYLSSRLLIAFSLFSSLIVSLYNLIKSPPLTLLPFQFGWEIMLDVYKNISNFLFGIGPTNFPYAFTVFKPIAINNSPYWNMIPNQSTSFLLTLATEAGIIALSIFIIMIVKIIYQSKTNRRHYLPSLLTAIFILVILPANISLLFLFIIILASFATKTETAEINIFRFKPVPYFMIAFLITIGFGLFWQTKLIISDILFKTALMSANENNYEKSSGYLDQAFRMNPYAENNYLFSSGLNQKFATDLSKENLSSDSAKQKAYSNAILS